MMLILFFLYLLVVVVLGARVIMSLQRAQRTCMYNRPGCGCLTSKSTFYVHSAESRNGGAWIPGAAADGARIGALARQRLDAKRPPDQVARGR